MKLAICCCARELSWSAGFGRPEVVVVVDAVVVTVGGGLVRRVVNRSRKRVGVVQSVCPVPWLDSESTRRGPLSNRCGGANVGGDLAGTGLGDDNAAIDGLRFGSDANDSVVVDTEGCSSEAEVRSPNEVPRLCFGLVACSGVRLA